MTDVSLNGLKVKTDSLPNDWYVSLINPKSSEPAEIMTVAKFVELFTPKQPEATNTSNGLMSDEDRVRLPLGVTRDESYQTVHIAKFGPYAGAVLLLAEASTEGRSGGFGILQVSGGKDSVAFKYTTLGETHSAADDGYLSTPIYVVYNSDKTCDVYAKKIQRPEKNRFGILALATSTPMDLYKVDNIPTGAVPVQQQRFSFTQAALSASQNALTDTISDNYSILPPPRKLRAKLLRISRFRGAICGIRYVGNRQPGWFNSS